MSSSDTKAPLAPVVFHILLALAHQNLHGYALMQAVGEQSGGRLRLRTGSLYRHLAALIDEGLVAEAPRRRKVEDSRRGVDYRLTASGRRALDHERRYLADVMVTLDALGPGLGKDLA
ncbi:MAG TPA: helix-turn-helix transcriptional regulator [Luteitalea sp.]|nr:helix-turn-helix transcriptional regulator [Luteitalea sp.]